MRLYRNGEIAAGETCAACGERRRHFLVRGEIEARDVCLAYDPSVD
jgi:hypothetical protein